jgi:hypothetical protein
VSWPLLAGAEPQAAGTSCRHLRLDPLHRTGADAEARGDLVHTGVAFQQRGTDSFLGWRSDLWPERFRPVTSHIARRALHSALTLVQKSRRLPGVLDRNRKGRCVIASDEETENRRLIAGSSFGAWRAAKLLTAFSTAFSFVANGPVMAALRFWLVDASVQYHPSDTLSAFPKNTPTSDGTLPILPPFGTFTHNGFTVPCRQKASAPAGSLDPANRPLGKNGEP